MKKKTLRKPKATNSTKADARKSLVVRKSIYTIELTQYVSGVNDLKVNNNGFKTHEIIGLLEVIKKAAIGQIKFKQNNH